MPSNYTKGRQLRKVQDIINCLENDKLIFVNLRWKRPVAHPTIFMSMTLRTIMIYLEHGLLFIAKKNA